MASDSNLLRAAHHAANYALQAFQKATEFLPNLGDSIVALNRQAPGQVTLTAVELMQRSS